jgi:Heterokaryon incompatibility protein (HET)
MGDSSGYAYKPLVGGPGLIRLLTILPRDDDDEIKCELSPCRLDESLVYNALSYVWGNTKVCKRILLDGCSFPVTTNLYAGLYRLRDRVQPRVFWIDAICIDQENDEERSEQVRQMRRVYECAETVVIWLGNVKELSEELGRIKTLLETLVEDAEQTRYFDDMEKDSDTAFGIRQRFWYKFSEVVDRRKILPCLRFLYNNCYWSRVWTLQEFVLGRRILVRYGNSSMDFQVLERVNKLIFDTAQDIVNPQTGLALTQGLNSSLGKSLMGYPLLKEVYDISCLQNDTSVGQVLNSAELTAMLGSLQNPNMDYRVDLRDQISGRTLTQLYTLLVKTSEAHASHPKDKIFALLSLATDGDDKSVQPDYTKTLAEISKELTQDLIKRENSLVPLRVGSHERPETERLPSWCPDWSRSHNNWERGIFHGFKCSGPLFPDVSFSEDLDILKAYGLGVSKIERCTKIDGGAPPMHKSDEEIVVECVKYGMCPSDPWSEEYRGCETYAEVLIKVFHLREGLNPSQKGIVTWKSHRDVTTGPIILFKTHDGLVGRAFDDIKECDLVCILRGGNAPCILRMETNHWIFISQCYGKL